MCDKPGHETGCGRNCTADNTVEEEIACLEDCRLTLQERLDRIDRKIRLLAAGTAP